MRRGLRMAALAGLLGCWAAAAMAGIGTTRHNLSASGAGTVKATSETQICVFCHAPHNSSPIAPLWNRKTPAASYVPYSSSTAKAVAGQPTGSSLNCLSCHDGTIAMGDVLSRASRIAMSGGATTLPAGRTNLGTDLSDDHPVSIRYDASLAAAHGGQLVDPSTLNGRVRLDAGNRVQCTSCHDPHDDSNGKFLVMSNQAGALCAACHVPTGWAAASHRLSNSTWNGTGTTPWPHTSGTTVAANACENCHRPHTAGGKKWLMNSLQEEANCYSCHNGSVATKNIQAEFVGKLSIHPVATTTGVHDAAEQSLVQSRHVECQDCHNPHASNASTGALAGSLTGVKGVDINGVAVNPSTTEYQICFRCHADSTGQPAPYVARQIPHTNTRLQFSPGNPSTHAVAGPGRSTKVPSLIAPWTISSIVKCTDCHNNNAGPGAGGTGPKGPHGSTIRPLMERPYTLNSTPTAGEICFKCHSQTAVKSESPHNRSEHLRYGCKACHDPHGIPSTLGNTTNNSRLINLSTTDNTPVGTGAAAKLAVDTVARKCYLVCHGESHNGRSY